MIEFEEEKNALRKQMKALRRELFSPYKSEEIARRFFVSPMSRKKRFFIYLSFGTEVDTAPVIRGLKGELYVPRISGGALCAVAYGGELIKNPLGFQEPRCGEDSPVEVALVPLLAVDRSGYRLGYGGGYYDGYFSTHESVLRVGLFFEGQAVEHLPHTERDIPLDIAISEKRTITFSERGEGLC